MSEETNAPVKNKTVIKKVSNSNGIQSKSTGVKSTKTITKSLNSSITVKKSTVVKKPVKKEVESGGSKFDIKLHIEYAIDELKRFQDFSGKTGFVEAMSYLGLYIAFVFAATLFTMIMIFVGLGSIMGPLMSLIQLALLVPHAGVCVRRYNDFNSKRKSD